MYVKDTGKNGVIIQYDEENSNRAIVVAQHEAIKLRDLLLREFPVNPVPPAEVLRPITEADLDAERIEIAKERRERIATAVLAGMLTQTPRDPDWAATEAIEQADALITALDRD